MWRVGTSAKIKSYMRTLQPGHLEVSKELLRETTDMIRNADALRGNVRNGALGRPISTLSY